MHGLYAKLAPARAVRAAAATYFTADEISQGRVERDTLVLHDARFKLTSDGRDLEVEQAPDDVWLADHLDVVAPARRMWEVAAFLKVRRMATPQDIVDRARSGELYNEAYFTKRGGGGPYVGYPYAFDGHAEPFEELADAIASEMAPQRALDVGCATGVLVKALEERGVAAAGVDISEWAVANRLTESVVHGVATALPWSDASFDLVISQDCMEHMHPDDLPAVLAEQRRVLQPGGRIMHFIPFYDFDTPIQVDAHLCQASQAWWTALLSAQPGLRVVQEPDAEAVRILDRYFALAARS